MWTGELVKFSYEIVAESRQQKPCCKLNWMVMWTGELLQISRQIVPSFFSWSPFPPCLENWEGKVNWNCIAGYALSRVIHRIQSEKLCIWTPLTGIWNVLLTVSIWLSIQTWEPPPHFCGNPLPLARGTWGYGNGDPTIWQYRLSTWPPGQRMVTQYPRISIIWPFKTKLKLPVKNM